jgi:hypothetical protein
MFNFLILLSLGYFLAVPLFGAPSLADEAFTLRALLGEGSVLSFLFLFVVCLGFPSSFFDVFSLLGVSTACFAFVVFVLRFGALSNCGVFSVGIPSGFFDVVLLRFGGGASEVELSSVGVASGFFAVVLLRFATPSVGFSSTFFAFGVVVRLLLEVSNVSSLLFFVDALEVDLLRFETGTSGVEEVSISSFGVSSVTFFVGAFGDGVRIFRAVDADVGVSLSGSFALCFRDVFGVAISEFFLVLALDGLAACCCIGIVEDG